MPDPDEQRKRRAVRHLGVDPGATLDRADACPFAPRCPHAIDVCRTSRPPLESTPAGTLVACHRWREVQG